MDLLVSAIDQPLLASLRHLLDAPSAPTRAILQEATSIASTPADVKESPTSYSFMVDMPGLKSEDIRVEVEEEENKVNVLKVSGERKRENEEEKEKGTGGVKYLRMERRVGKFMRNFVLPEDADEEKVAAVCRDGVLTVTVEKKEKVQPEEKKRRIEVRIE